MASSTEVLPEPLGPTSSVRPGGRSMAACSMQRRWLTERVARVMDVRRGPAAICAVAAPPVAPGARQTFHVERAGAPRAHALSRLLRKPPPDHGAAEAWPTPAHRRLRTAVVPRGTEAIATLLAAAGPRPLAAARAAGDPPSRAEEARETKPARPADLR